MKISQYTQYKFEIKAGETNYTLTKVAGSEKEAAQIIISELKQTIQELEKIAGYVKK